MKVLFLTREYPPFVVGGVAVHTFNLIKHLTKLGVSCKVLSFGNDKLSSGNVVFVNPSSSIIERGDSSIFLDAKIPLDIVRFSRIAKRFIKKEKFDIIHVEEPYVGAYIQQTGNQVKVSTVHDTSFGEIQAIVRHSFEISSFKRIIFYFLFGFFLEFLSIASSGVLLVPTPQVKKELVKIYRASNEKIKIVRNGVELPDLNKTVDNFAAKQRLGLDPEGILIFSVARMVSRKRLDLLVKAAKILNDKGLYHYHVVIAGDGPFRQNLKNLAQRCGLSDIVEFPGWISDEQKNLYYQAADIFVLTSDYEGFPFTMLEAMSYGAAIVNSKIQGLNPVRDGINGLLFPAGDFHALSDCLKRLLNDASLRTRLSHSARLFAEEFSWEKVAKETKNLYQDLINFSSDMHK